MARAPHYPAIPMLYTSGTHYEVGYSIGLTFADNIRRFWTESTEVNNVDVPYNNTPDGKQFYDTSLAVCQQCFPQYVRELQGMADGAGMEFRELFILNISKEVHNVLHREASKSSKLAGATLKPDESSGCSDIFLNKPGCKFLAHNEDCDPQIKPYGYIVKARIMENGEEVENFTSFCYPGVLAGTTVSFNSHGLFFSVDGLYAAFVAHGAPSRMFLNRSIIRAKSVDDAVTLARNPGYGAAYGFTVNIADVSKNQSLWSLEIFPEPGEAKVHVHEIREGDPTKPETCYYMHFNCFKHNETVAQIPNRRSSSQRGKTAESLPPPTNKQEMLRILGDTSHPDYPIYRTNLKTDPSETIFTAQIDVLEQKVYFYQGNPGKEDAVPLMVFRMFD